MKWIIGNIIFSVVSIGCIIAIFSGFNQNKVKAEVSKDAKYVAVIPYGTGTMKVYCTEIQLQNHTYNGYVLTTVDNETIYTLNATVFDINSKYIGE